MRGKVSTPARKPQAMFRAGEFDFFGIPKVIESVMAKHENDFKADPTLEDILEADAWAREMVAEESARVSKGGVLIG